MAKPFKQLRDKLPPEVHKRAQEKTEKMLSEIDHEDACKGKKAEAEENKELVSPEDFY